MPRTLLSAASLSASPDALFDAYVDALAHAAITGAAVTIEPRAGAPFSAFGGVLSGTILHVEPKRLLAQTWRSARWPADAIDSILTLTFWPEEGRGRIEVVHANVPEEDFAGVSHGWERYYWAPWRNYLAGRPNSP